MAKKKFNLKTYVKISGDDHIEQRLRDEQHGGEPNEINEAQLEEHRATEPTVITEEQLENQRGGNKEATEVTERQLDTKKAKFNNKYRNPSVYEGDINKVEEERLLGSPVEDEKYESASTTSKGLQWWNKTDDPMGLKLAKDRKEVKTAQELDLGRQRWEGIQEEDTQYVDTDTPAELDASGPESLSLGVSEEFDIFDVTDSDIFEEVAYTFEPDNTGTPVHAGAIRVNTEVNDFNSDSVIRGVVDFLNDKHPDLDISDASLNIDQLISEGIVTFSVAEVSTDFPIDEISSSDFEIVIAKDTKKK